MNTLITTLFSILAILSLISSAIAAPVSEIQSNTFYVKPGETGDCLGWSTACELQTALSLAEPGDQIWVAAATYRPTTLGDRDTTFQLESGVAIYGGFPDAGGTWNERDWETNITTLSGNIGDDGENDDNSYHVVTGSGVDGTAILDGFTVCSGNANGSDPHNYGGGMFNNTGSPTLTNVTFSGNSAEYGGGMYNYYHSNPSLTNVTFSENTGSGMYNDFSSSPTLSNVTFSGNSGYSGSGMRNSSNSNPTLSNVIFSGNSAEYGGGMHNAQSCPTLTDVTFSGNSANYGGGMYNAECSPTLIDVTLTENSATYFGGGIYNDSSSPTLTNIIFSGNYAESGGGGMHNYESSPILTHVSFHGNSASFGGGMKNESSSPTLTDISFNENSAAYGGGMYNTNNCNPTLTNITFSNNSADYGGGIFNTDYSNPSLTNITFSGNGAVYEGGGMVNYQSSSPSLTNVTFYHNRTQDSGGGMINYESNPILINSIVWGNTPDQINNNNSSPTVTYSDIQGGYTGIGNIDQDPFLGPLMDNGGFTLTLALGANSPAIDSGYPAVCPSTDQRGFPRPFDGDGDGVAICDMGAYESEITPVIIYLPLIVK